MSGFTSIEQRGMWLAAQPLGVAPNTPPSSPVPAAYRAPPDQGEFYREPKPTFVETPKTHATTLPRGRPMPILTQRARLPGLRLAGRERIAEMLAHFANHMPRKV